MIVNDADITFLLKKHTVFKQISQQFGSPPSWQRPQGFESVCKIILEQQVSLASAAAHFTALKKYIGEFIPENILKLTAEELRACYISKQKSVYLKALSQAVLDETIKFQEHNNMPDDAIKKQLITVKGIGDWTADVYLMMCLQRKDIFPIGDIALQQAVKKLLSLTTKEEVLVAAEDWRPLRSLAAYFLWHWYLGERKASNFIAK